MVTVDVLIDSVGVMRPAGGFERLAGLLGAVFGDGAAEDLARRAL